MDRETADYEITGTPEIEKEQGSKGWVTVAEIGLTGRHTGNSVTARASFLIKSVQSGELIFSIRSQSRAARRNRAPPRPSVSISTMR
jgi:hypothetical protein